MNIVKLTKPAAGVVPVLEANPTRATSEPMLIGLDWGTNFGEPNLSQNILHV